MTRIFSNLSRRAHCFHFNSIRALFAPSSSGSLALLLLFVCSIRFAGVHSHFYCVYNNMFTSNVMCKQRQYNQKIIFLRWVHTMNRTNVEYLSAFLSRSVIRCLQLQLVAECVCLTKSSSFPLNLFRLMLTCISMVRTVRMWARKSKWECFP